MAKLPIAAFYGTAFALAAIASAPAQNESRGVLAGAATAIFVDGPTPGGDADGTTLVHPNGFAQLAPRQFGALPSAPNLRAILQQHGAPPALDIDDISSGIDDILVDSDGMIDVPSFQWSVWSFSMKRGAVGRPGSKIAIEAATGNVGVALFSYVLPGSSLPAPFVGRTERSHSRRDLGIGGIDPDVDAIDMQLMFGLDQQLTPAGSATATEPGFVPLLGSPQRIFFTVSHATRHLVPILWWRGRPPSGASILETSRSAPGGTWSRPALWKEYSDLGLDQNEDIDGLAVEGRLERVLFSCVGTARDQFLYADLTDGTIPKIVVLPNGNPVGDNIGKAQTDDVDAICTLDPNLTDIYQLPAIGDVFGNTCGAPRDGLFGTPEINGSAYRRYEGGQIRFDSFMLGWPDATGPAPALAACFLTTDDNIDPILVGGLHVRDPNSNIPGDPQSKSVVVPPVMALSSLRFTLRWVQVDWPSGVLSEAWPVQIFL